MNNSAPEKQENNSTARDTMLDELRLEVAKGWDGPDSKRTATDIIAAGSNARKQSEEHRLGRLIENEKTGLTVSRKSIFKHLDS